MFLWMLKNKIKSPEILRNTKFVWKYLKIFLQDIILDMIVIDQQKHKQLQSSTAVWGL